MRLIRFSSKGTVVAAVVFCGVCAALVLARYRAARGSYEHHVRSHAYYKVSLVAWTAMEPISEEYRVPERFPDLNKARKGDELRLSPELLAKLERDLKERFGSSLLGDTKLTDLWGRPLRLKLWYVGRRTNVYGRIEHELMIKVLSLGPNGRDEDGRGDDVVSECPVSVDAQPRSSETP